MSRAARRLAKLRRLERKWDDRYRDLDAELWKWGFSMRPSEERRYEERRDEAKAKREELRAQIAELEPTP